MTRILFILLFLSPMTMACTMCNTATGSAVRAGIFNESFPITFLQVTAPFYVLGAVLFALNRYLPD